MPASRREFLASSVSCTAASAVLLSGSMPGNLFGAEMDSAQVQDSSSLSPYLNQVLECLNLEFPALAPFLKDAESPEEKQTALLNYFRSREIASTYELFHGRDLNELRGKTRKPSSKAELALKHIFYGQPAYEPDFRGKDEIDWDTNPHKDKEWIWQFHRFTWLENLAEEYVRSGDEKYAREWLFEMNSWIRHMHQPKNAFSHPGWRSLDTALRMRAWACTFEFFLKSPTLTARTLVDLLYSFNVHSQRILNRCLDARKRGGPLGNWDIFHTEGILFAAAALPERKNSTMEVQTAAQLFIEFQKRVLLSDGVINEFIPSYHSAYPGQFMRLVHVCRKLNLPVEIPKEFMERLEKSINAMVVWSHPDGTSPVFGDAWLTPPDRNRNWIKPYLSVFDRPDWIWFASKGKEGKMPDSLQQELPAAGYYTMRSDWSETARFIVAKNSNTDRMGHNQADNLTFELSAYGQRLMTDSGCYNYSGEPEWRKYFRSPSVHQLVSLDQNSIRSRGRKVGQKSIPKGPESHSAEILVLENAPSAGFLHRRTFQLIDGRFFVILDELSGKAAGELRQHFQFLPGDWQLEKTTLRAWTKHPEKVNLILAGARIQGAEISLEEEEGWISTRYMEKERRPAFAFIQRKEPQQICRFAVVLYPVQKGEMVEPAQLDFQLHENRSWTLTLGKEKWDGEF